MGLYATTTSLSELMPGALQGDTTTSDAKGTNIWSRHVDRAEGIINSALVARYTLPFATIPPLVRLMAEDIACWYWIRGVGVQDASIKNEMLAPYEQAFDDLTAISKGEKKLAATDGSLIATNPARFLSSATGFTPIFGLDNPRAWKRDQDEVDAQEDARDT